MTGGVQDAPGAFRGRLSLLAGAVVRHACTEARSNSSRSHNRLTCSPSRKSRPRPSGSAPSLVDIRTLRARRTPCQYGRRIAPIGGLRVRLPQPLRPGDPVGHAPAALQSEEHGACARWHWDVAVEHVESSAHGGVGRGALRALKGERHPSPGWGHSTSRRASAGLFVCRLARRPRGRRGCSSASTRPRLHQRGGRRSDQRRLSFHTPVAGCPIGGIGGVALPVSELARLRAPARAPALSSSGNRLGPCRWLSQ